MNKDSFHVPATRSWRDIPQPVKPRAMSAGGRWRLTFAAFRAVAVLAVLSGTGWSAWFVARALQENPQSIPVAAKAQPLKAIVLKTDGVLDDAWLAEALALPKNISLFEFDLAVLQARLLEHGQVLTANLTRSIPGRLVVQITERSPVARLMAEWNGRQDTLLVARDGVVFPGRGYPEELLRSLPWLDGLTLSRRGDEFVPIRGMEAVSNLLAQARLHADHLYRSWSVLSLARLHDREIVVRTDRGVEIVFNATADFFGQLARLDYMCGKFAQRGVVPGRIDLSLGSEVPVTLAAVGAPAERASVVVPENVRPLFVLPSQSNHQREL